MNKENDYIDVPEDEITDDYAISSFNIRSWGADFSFRELITQYEEGDLVKPEMQRKYVWDKSEASRFIDSILLGLPIPSIFLAKTSENKMLIIDGYQRLMTVHDYYKGIFSTDKKVFKLSNSKKINPKWRNKSFLELTEIEKRKILTTTIHSIIFVQLEPKENDTSMYLIFERLNTSGRTLFPQEIRNCIYQGAFNTLLFDINENNDTWRKLFGSMIEDIRMRDMEYILRFLALDSQEYRDIEAKQLSLKKFLNEFMGSNISKDPVTLLKRKEKFNKTVEMVYSLFGDEAFQNISSKDPRKLVKKFNPTIYDSIMIATHRAIEKNIANVKPNDAKKRRLALLSDEIYQDLIKIRTTGIDRINARIDLASKYIFGE